MRERERERVDYRHYLVEYARSTHSLHYPFSDSIKAPSNESDGREATGDGSDDDDGGRSPSGMQSTCYIKQEEREEGGRQRMRVSDGVP